MANVANLKSVQKILDETRDSPIVVSRTFDHQSFFTLNGVPAVYDNHCSLSQPAGKLIVSPQVREVSGYAVGLHPTAETPIAIRFLAGQASTPSPLYTLMPGQIVRPLGEPGGKTMPFAAFEWGLPWGWLGGGAAPLWVFKSPDAKVDWGTARPEVCFHRFKSLIQSLTANAINTDFPRAARTPNWPTRFPWKNAQSYLGTAQGGNGNISVQPTRTFLWTPTTLAGPADVLCVLANGDAMEKRGSLTGASVYETWDLFQVVTFPAAPAIPAYAVPLLFPGFTAQVGMVEVTDGPLARFGGDDASVMFFDLSDGNLLNAAEMYVIRYGKV